MTELGFDVVGVDSDPAKVEALVAGRLPFLEPELADLIQVHLASGRLRFTSGLAEAVGAQRHPLHLRRHTAERGQPCGQCRLRRERRGRRGASDDPRRD